MKTKQNKKAKTQNNNNNYKKIKRPKYQNTILACLGFLSSSVASRVPQRGS